MNIYSGLESLPSREGEIEAKEQLKKALEISNGVLRIAVHPFYMDWDLEHRSSYLTERDKLEVHQKNRDAHMRLFTSEAEEKPPVLILEGVNEIAETKDKLTSVGSNVFMFPTFPGEPFPYYGDISDEEDGNYDAIVWDRFNQMLHEVGVQEVIVSGMMLFLENNDLDQEEEGSRYQSLLACVGGVARYLSPDFKVSISRMTSPDKLKIFK